jgi:type I restriction enzyme S subunit
MSFETRCFGDLLAEPQRNGLNRPKKVRGSGLPMVNMGELFAYPRIKNIEMDLVPIEDKEMHYCLSAGDLLFARQSLVLAGAGQCSIFQGNYLPTVFESHLIRCRLDLVKSNPHFYFYFFRSPVGRKLMEEIIEQGAGASGIRASDLVKLLVPFPNKKTQDAIADFLSALDDRIALLRETNQTLEAIAQALFKSWFVDFDPVRAKADGRLPEGIGAATAALFPDTFEESELGMVPKGWRYSTVQNAFVLTMGQSPPGSTYSTDNSDMPFYQGCTDFGFRFPTQRMYCSAPTRLAETGDTLVSVRAPVGDVNMAIEKCCIGRGLASVRHPNFQSFTFYAISNLGNHFKNFDTEGTIFGSINKADFQSLPVIDAPLNVVTEFENIAKQLDSKVVQNEYSLRVLSELRDTLLPRLISGQLRIADAEAELEKATA